MKYSGKPFLSAKGYAFFLEDWCYGCTHYKAREDGFPEFPEYGGCKTLDAMGRAMFNSDWFPKKYVTIEERDEYGNVIRCHKCTKFKGR